MSLEAVPCMFRSPSQDGNGETQILGLIIRQTGAPGAPSAPVQVSTAGVVHGMSRQTVVAGGSGGPNNRQVMMGGSMQRQPTKVVVQGGEQPPPKMLMKLNSLPPNMRVRLPPGETLSWTNGFTVKQATVTNIPNRQQNGYTPATTSTFQTIQNAVLSTESPSPVSPAVSYSHQPSPYQNNGPQSVHQMEQVRRPNNTNRTNDAAQVQPGQWVQPGSNSSTTPDSGIQSVPGTPDAKVLSPPVAEPCSSLEEPSFCDDGEDFADMPCLLPADQDGHEHSPFAQQADDTTQSPVMSLPSTSSAPPRYQDESVESSAHGSECEQPPIPSISITPGMDPSEIAEQLLQHMDPDKVKTVSNLMRRKAKQVTKEQTRGSESRSNSANGDRDRKRARPESSASEELKRSEEESKSFKFDDAPYSCGLPSPQLPQSCRTSSFASPSQNLIDGQGTPIPSISSPLAFTCLPSTSKQSPSEAASPLENTQEVQIKGDNESAWSPAKPSITCYREAVRRLLDERVTRMWETMFGDFTKLRISGESRCHRKTSHVTTPPSIFKKIDWNALKKRGRKEKATEKDKRTVHGAKQPERRSASIKEEKKGELKDRSTPTTSRQQTLRRERNESSCSEGPSAKGRKRAFSGSVESSKRDRSLEGEKKKAAIQSPKRLSDGLERKRSESEKRKRRSDEVTDESKSKELPLRKRLRDAKDEEDEHPTDYEPISNNVACGSCPGWAQPPPDKSCGCTKTCGPDCSYRLLRVQCPNTCQAPGCTNKPFACSPQSAIHSIGPHGRRGLFTNIRRAKGEFVCEFVGEVVVAAEMFRRLEKDYKDTTPYSITLSSRLFVDATRKGNAARYVDHSCKPNAEIQTWLVNGRLRAGIFVVREVSADSEITVDLRYRRPRGSVCDCGVCDDQWLAPSRHPVLSVADDLSINEESAVRKHSIFLPRTRTNTIEYAKKSCGPILLPPVSRFGRNSPAAMRHVLRLLARRVRRPDGTLPRRALLGYTTCVRALRTRNPEVFQTAVTAWAEKMKVEAAYRMLHARYLEEPVHNEVDEREGEKKRRENEEKRRGGILAGHADLSYLDSKSPVGSYAPDDAWPHSANEGDDAVRCVCGALEEDGEMLQCDGCHFWLHLDCIGLDTEESPDEYQCDFCTGKVPKERGPSTDVLLKTQPEFRLDGCTYYKSLLNQNSLQVRLNETVYVEKLNGDEHKKALKKSLESTAADNKEKGKKKGKKSAAPPPREFSRSDLRIMRVERLFTTPDGKRYLFGFYYARPHETFCDPNKIFHTSEVFATPLYDTLPLESVAGRCIVLDSTVWMKGRPRIPKFVEEDVLLCEFQIGRNQRTFERVPLRNRFFVNTQPYVFDSHERPVDIERTLRPFVLSSSSSSITVPHQPKGSVDSDEERKVAVDRLSRVVNRLQKIQEKTKKK